MALSPPLPFRDRLRLSLEAAESAPSTYEQYPRHTAAPQHSTAGRRFSYFIQAVFFNHRFTFRLPGVVGVTGLNHGTFFTSIARRAPHSHCSSIRRKNRILLSHALALPAMGKGHVNFTFFFLLYGSTVLYPRRASRKMEHCIVSGTN